MPVFVYIEPTGEMVYNEKYVKGFRKEKQKMKKKKTLVILGILAILLAFGLPRLHIQSVSDYQKEQKELAAGLEMKTGDFIEESSDKGEVSSGELGGDLTESSGEMMPQENISSEKDIFKKEKTNKESLTAETKKSTTENQNTQNTSNESQNQKNRVKNKKNNSSAKKKQVSSKESQKGTPNSEKAKDASNSKKEEKTITCSLEIICHQLVKNKGNVDKSIEKYIPANGEILSKVTVKMKAGATAYDLLSTVCKASGVALDAEYTPVYGTYYVRGIGHIYEKQAGKRSGWIYKINGVSPNVGASDYKLSDGDICSWSFTCDGKSS